MSKKISLFLDGTWNTPDSETNVYKLFSITKGQKVKANFSQLKAPAWKKIYRYLKQKLFNETINHDQIDKKFNKLINKEEIRYYDKGVGTRFFNRIRGGAFGKGVSENIYQAYYFLCNVWEPGDEIYVFGFSRGAYTARSLVGLLDLVGLMDERLSRDNENRKIVMQYLHDYIKYLHNQNQKDLGYKHKNIDKPKKPSLLEDIPRWRQKTPVKLIGVWDTVGSLGVHSRFKHLLSGFTFDVHETLGNTEVCNNVEYAYHAMAIDEHRVDFQVTPWTYPQGSTDLPKSLKQLEQAWFVGAHANIGGGYKDNSLSDNAYGWMIAKAARAGLKFQKEHESNNCLICAKVRNSYKEFAGGLHKIFNNPILRDIDINPSPKPGKVINATIHSSVWKYVANHKDYRPKNIPSKVADLYINPELTEDEHDFYNSLLAE